MAAVVVILLSLLGCVPARPAPDPNDPMEKPTTLVAIAGPEDSLAHFEAAAAKCGLTGVVREPNAQLGGTMIRVVGPTSWITKDRSPYKCAFDWLLNHPDEKIGFLGNEAFAPER